VHKQNPRTGLGFATARHSRGDQSIVQCPGPWHLAVGDSDCRPLTSASTVSVGDGTHCDSHHPSAGIWTTAVHHTPRYGRLFQLL